MVVATVEPATLGVVVVAVAKAAAPVTAGPSKACRAGARRVRAERETIGAGAQAVEAVGPWTGRATATDAWRGEDTRRAAGPTAPPGGATTRGASASGHAAGGAPSCGGAPRGVAQVAGQMVEASEGAPRGASDGGQGRFGRGATTTATTRATRQEVRNSRLAMRPHVRSFAPCSVVGGAGVPKMIGTSAPQTYRDTQKVRTAGAAAARSVAAPVGARGERALARALVAYLPCRGVVMSVAAATGRAQWPRSVPTPPLVRCGRTGTAGAAANVRARRTATGAAAVAAAGAAGRAAGVAVAPVMARALRL